MAGEIETTGGDDKTVTTETGTATTALGGASADVTAKDAGDALTDEQKATEATAAAATAAAEAAKLEADLKSTDPTVKAAAEAKKAEIDKAAKDKTEGAPKDGYKDFTMPEGVEIDKTQLAKFTPLAQELNLSQDQAQKVVSLAADWKAEMVKESYATWEKIKAGWLDNAKGDAEIGKQGWDANLGSAKEALNAIDPIPEGKDSTPFRDMLEITGTGNHPEMIRHLYRLSKITKEHKLVFGNGASDTKVDPSAKDLYPASNMK